MSDIETKEKTLVFTGKEEKEYNGKKLWDFETEEGDRFASWSKTVVDAIKMDVAAKVRYTVKKNGQYTNRTLVAVWDGAKWLAEERKAFGNKPFDSEGANKRACLQAAATIVATNAKSQAQGTQAATFAVLAVTAELMSKLFGKAALATVEAPKPRVVPLRDEVAEEVEQAEEVAF